MTGVNSVRGFESPPLRQFLLPRAARGLVAALLLLPAAFLCACAGPTLTIQAVPRDSAVYLDNRQVPASAPAVRRLPYYGTLQVEAEHKDRLPQARRIAVDEPVTPWVFPFDFPLELIARMFGSRNDVRVDLQLVPTEGAPPAPLPATELLRARSAAAGVRR